MSDRVCLTVIPAGPLKVENATSLRYCGAPLTHDGDAYLCRCGESKNAPFCDGSHSKSGFTGDNESPRTPELRVWEGSSIRTFFNTKTCMHVFYCKPLKELRERELTGDKGAASEIVNVVNSCPSGALSYELKEDLPLPPPQEAGADIDIVEGGEIRVQVEFSINEDLHEKQKEARATLCRCGQSKNKPWCDGRHRKRDDFR